MEQKFFHYSSLLQGWRLDQLYDELSKEKMPLSVLFEDGTVSNFLSLTSNPVAIKWKDLYLALETKTCNWSDASIFCLMYQINGKSCRMFTYEELWKFTLHDFEQVNLTLEKLGKQRINAKLWCGNVSSECPHLAYVKNVEKEVIVQSSYVHYKDFFAALPVISVCEIK